MLLPLLLLALLAPHGRGGEGVLVVRPMESLARVSERLANDASIREVVLQAGTYPGAWSIPPLAGADAAEHPLLIRAADGAQVVFEGARPLPGAHKVKGRPGVFSALLGAAPAGEPPKLWEPEARVRYLLAADLDAVQQFPGSYILEDRTIYLHPAGSGKPGARAVLASVQDFGIEVRRPHVTVRGIVFRNFTARAKWSAAVQVRADHVTVERCDVTNASFGFTLLADDAALLDNTARDVGGGVYAHGMRPRIERNRFFKTRDDFVIPTYVQDDTGIQAYYPVEAGTIRGNLAVGFGMGILIKASPTPWVVEENTLVTGDSKYGFAMTAWLPESKFRGNVVAGYDVPAQFYGSKTGPDVAHNCYEPVFVDAAGGDYRLAPDSPCLATPPEAGQAIGAGEAARSRERNVLRRATPAQAGSATVASSRAAPPPAEGTRSAETAGDRRAWHVSPAGRDGAAGTDGAPLRSIQEAVDRARPGDTILLHPGLYSEPVRMDRGGTAERPITLRATERWKAILDGGRRHDALVLIDGAPFVVVQDLEIRWYRVAGIHVRKSDDVRVEGCRIWNAHWGGNWAEGDGVLVEAARRFTGTRNVISNQERGFELLSSPGATLTHNTAVMNLYGAAVFVHSIEGTTCTNNSFAYQGNDAIAIFEREGGKKRLESFTLDYNNYGVTLSGADGEPPLQPRPRDRRMKDVTKAIVYFEESPAPYRRFRTMAAWREFSGLDAHTIFADPLYVDSAARDFRVEPESPNRGAGEDGATIGAFTD